MRHNVTTPGGFFVGIVGIAAFCVVSSGVYLLVSKPAKNTELESQQAALGLIAPLDSKDAKTIADKKAETDALLDAAARKYNEGKRPNIDKLADLRGVIRYREAQKVAEASAKLLDAPSSIAGKSVLAAAIEETAKELAAKKPAPSKVALAEIAPADPTAAPTMPNFGGGGTRTMQFVNPNAAPAAPATPANPSAPQEAAKPGNAQLEASAPAVAVAPNRPALLNSPETK